MSFHPNDVVRRGRAASVIVCSVLAFLLSAFFRAQVIRNQDALLQSEENRLRQIPTAAPRGRILDRHGKLIAENVVGYSVTLIAQSEDTLRSTLSIDSSRHAAPSSIAWRWGLPPSSPFTPWSPV